RRTRAGRRSSRLAASHARSRQAAWGEKLMAKHTLALLVGVVLAACLAWTAEVKSPPRRPVALALADDSRWLFAANRRAGTVSVIDTAAAKSVAEMSVGGQLADLVITPDGGHLLAVDEAAGELIRLKREGSQLKPAQRVKVGPTPVCVRASADGAR